MNDFRQAETAAVPFHFMRKPEVLQVVGISKSTLHAWIKVGKFPKPVHLPGGGIAAWVSTEVSEWMAAAVTARDGTQTQAA